MLGGKIDAGRDLADTGKGRQVHLRSCTASPNNPKNYILCPDFSLSQLGLVHCKSQQCKIFYVCHICQCLSLSFVLLFIYTTSPGNVKDFRSVRSNVQCLNLYFVHLNNSLLYCYSIVCRNVWASSLCLIQFAQNTKTSQKKNLRGSVSHRISCTLRSKLKRSYNANWVCPRIIFTLKQGW